MVWLRWPDPEAGDQHVEMAPQEVVDFIAENSKTFKLGVWEEADESILLEAEMVNKTNLLEVLAERQNDTLRLQPAIAGG
jgi:hypothetical protein